MDDLIRVNALLINEGDEEEISGDADEEVDEEDELGADAEVDSWQ